MKPDYIRYQGMTKLFRLNFCKPVTVKDSYQNFENNLYTNE